MNEALEILPAEPSLDGVRVHGMPDPSDYWKCYRLFRRCRPDRFLMVSRMVFLALSVYAVALSEYRIQATVVLGLFVLFSWLLRVGIRGKRIHQVLAKNRRTTTFLVWTFDARGVLAQIGPNEGFSEWRMYDRIAASDDLLMLLTTRYSFSGVPARFFESGNLSRVLQMAKDAGLPVLDLRKGNQFPG